MSVIGAVGALSGISLPAPVDTTLTAGVSAPGGADFTGVLEQGLQSLQETQTRADHLGVQAATGDLTDVHTFMIASTQAQLATDLTVTMRNKALEAFNDIMRMQA